VLASNTGDGGLLLGKDDNIWCGRHVCWCLDVAPLPSLPCLHAASHPLAAVFAYVVCPCQHLRNEQGGQ
jgi:hypothetical protein